MKLWPYLHALEVHTGTSDSRCDYHMGTVSVGGSDSP